LVLLIIDIVVTVIFNADVERQAGAYATGVLVLILSAAVAVSIALGDESRREQDPKKKLLSYYFWGLVVVFAYTFVTNVIERPDGLFIALFFIGGILLVGGLSRWQRATELRVEQVTLVDETSMALWPQLCSSKVCIVPLISNDQRTRTYKGKKIRSLYTLTDPLAFMHVTLRDDRSDFLSGLRVQVRQVDSGDYCIEVEGAVALANTIAYLTELVDPSSVCLGLTRKNMADQSLAFLLFGEGETGIMVYQILVKYWEWTTEDDKRPVIFLMSD
jgi:hypothetical protein